jgi:hypothetical protein
MILKMLVVAGALSAMTASARADITRIFFIEATDFRLDVGPGGEPPAEPVTVSLTVTFDPSKDILATTSGLTVNSFSLPFMTQFAYDKAQDTLVFGTDPAPAACDVDADSWCAFVDNATEAFPFVEKFFVSTENSSLWVAQHTMLDVGGAPEPSTWTLVILGFAGMSWRLIRGSGAAPLGWTSRADAADLRRVDFKGLGGRGFLTALPTCDRGARSQFAKRL